MFCLFLFRKDPAVFAFFNQNAYKQIRKKQKKNENSLSGSLELPRASTPLSRKRIKPPPGRTEEQPSVPSVDSAECRDFVGWLIFHVEAGVKSFNCSRWTCRFSLVSVFDDITANTTDATTKHGRDIGWGWISGHTAGVLPRPAWCAIRHLWKRQQLKRRTYAGDTRKWCQGSCSID
jgi:hypothetical protein